MPDRHTVAREQAYYRDGTGRIVVVREPEGKFYQIGEEVIINGTSCVIRGVERMMYAIYPPRKGDAVGLVIREKLPVEA